MSDPNPSGWLLKIYGIKLCYLQKQGNVEINETIPYGKTHQTIFDTFINSLANIYRATYSHNVNFERR